MHAGQENSLLQDERGAQHVMSVHEPHEGAVESFDRQRSAKPQEEGRNVGPVGRRCPESGLRRPGAVEGTVRLLTTHSQQVFTGDVQEGKSRTHDSSRRTRLSRQC